MTPLYEYECDYCGKGWEAFRSVEFRDRESCSHCGGAPKRVLSFNSKPVVQEYFSESLNAVITGPKQKARLLREKNLSEAG